MIQNLYPRVGVVIALKEEFLTLLNTLGVDFNELTSSPLKEYTIYELDYEISPNNSLNLVFLVLNDMGNIESALGTQYLLSKYTLSCIINIGISGLCSDDFHLCDVIIGSSSNEYDYRSKIVDENTTENRAFAILHGGQTFKPSNSLYSKLSQIETLRPDFYQGWQEISQKEIKKNIDSENLNKLYELSLITEKQIIQKGDIASGPSTITSVEFKEFLKVQNRNYYIIDMESAGFLKAIHNVENDVLSLVIKGISDPADERKKELDNIKSGAIRKIAMQNSVYVLKLFLESYSFVNKSFSFNVTSNQRPSSRAPVSSTSNDSLFTTTMSSKMKAPFGTNTIFEKESEWNKLFYLLSDNSEIEITEKYFIHNVAAFILNSQNPMPLKITGLPGSGISPFLSFLYRYLYRHFEDKKTYVYPLYFDFRLYRYKVYKDDIDILEQAQDYLNNDIRTIKEQLDSRRIKDIVLILDGVDYTSEFQMPLENIIVDSFDSYQSKKIIGIRNYAYIKNLKENDAEVQPLVANIKFLSVSTKSEKYESVLDCFSSICENTNLKNSIHNIFGISNFDFIDYFFLNLMNKMVKPNTKNHNVSYYLKLYCDKFFKAGNKQTGKNINILDAAKLAFDHQINKKKFFENELYNNPAWQLLFRHKRIQDYLIAEYIVHSLIDFANETDLSHFNFTYPYCINSFCKLLINENIETQNLIYRAAKEILTHEDDVSKHTNAIYLIGRLSDDKLRHDAIIMINEYLKNDSSNIDKLSIKTDNKKIISITNSIY